MFDLPTVGDLEESLPQGHAARLEQTLLQARALIESTMSLHRRRPATVSGVTHTDAEVTTETLERLILRARRSVNVALTGSVAFVETVLRCVAEVPSGVTVRVLCTPAALEVSPARLRGLAGVRILPHELSGFVVADGTSAFLRLATQGPADGRAAVVTDRAAVSTLQLLYAGVWSRGRRLVDHPEVSPRLRSELTRRILEQLRSGRTDATAAVELQVSLRTYRRHVAEIMRELNASSRFQAGVRAVELGLLPKAA
ncbi:DNA-binding response regulator [Streptomyces sp. SID7804]|uniref:LuxR family transcriptional regulator n=1 Tax=Streptomyces calvus TaxID=67282 RepID=A0A514JVJ8_9ACTN|nr:DNA-binding response regulator [Streptomyces sp. SID7804]QDI71417.1 LuxR family transcriptional regulator [Streptomyces calvus]